MFGQRIRVYPAPGKAAEMRAVLEESVRARHAQGKTSTLSQVVFGDDSGAFTILHGHDDLAAFQAFREMNQTDSASQARLQRLAGLTRQPANVHLFEILQLPPALAGPAARFGVTSTFTPVPGALPGLRAALEEYGAARNRAGTWTAILASASGTGRVLVISSYASMAVLEAARAAAAASPERAKLSGSLGGLMGTPPNSEIFEILLANPA